MKSHLLLIYVLLLLNISCKKKPEDYTKEDFTTSKGKYDFIFDAVGKSTFGKCKPLLKEKGIYISSELGPQLISV